mgnify:CR=1 FL=1
MYEYIKARLGGLDIKEHAQSFGVAEAVSAKFFYQRFLDITTPETMRIFRTQILYDDKLDDKDAELLRACEFAQSRLNELGH